MRNLGRYEIVSELGRGGCGIVYRAVDPSIGRTVAIKTILAETDSPADAALRERFRREAQAAGNLSHPNIVTIHEFNDSSNPMFIAMEFIDGQTLAESLCGTPLPLNFILKVLRSAADALDYAHAHHIIHRDVKPANFLIDKGGHLKIADFGIAKLLEADGAPVTLTCTGIVVGTAQYMSPEQISETSITGRSDQFSLAAIVYEMLTGVKAFQGGSWASLVAAIILTEPPPVTQYCEVSETVNAVIGRALSKAPEARYPTCREFCDALEHELLSVQFAGRDDARVVHQHAGNSHRFTQPPTIPVKKALPLKPALLVAVPVLAVGAWLGSRSHPDPRPRGNLYTAPGGASQGSASQGSAALSPPALPPSEAAARNTSKNDTSKKDSAKEAARDAARPAPAGAASSSSLVANARTVSPPPLSPPASPPSGPAAAALDTSKNDTSKNDTSKNDTSKKDIAEVVRETAKPAPAGAVAPSSSPVANAQTVSSPVTLQVQTLSTPPASAAPAAPPAPLPKRPEEDPKRTAEDPAKRLVDVPAKVTAEEKVNNARTTEFPAVSRALMDYQNAYQHKDLAALQTIWPSIPKPILEGIRSSFRDASDVSMDLRSLGDPEISGSTATVTCDRNLRQVILKKVLQASNRVRIVLNRKGAGWVIQSIEPVNR